MVKLGVAFFVTSVVLSVAQQVWTTRTYSADNALATIIMAAIATAVFLLVMKSVK